MEYTEPPIEPDLWDDIDRDERTTCRHCGTLGEDTGDECPRCERNRDTGRRIEPVFGTSARNLRPIKDTDAARIEAEAFWGVES